MKAIKFLVLLALLCAGCKKYKGLRDDVKGGLYLRGRLFYKGDYAKADTLSPLPLGGKTVKIGYSGDHGNNYINSTTTDADGYFTFTNLGTDSTYFVFAQDTEDSIGLYGKLIWKLKASLNTTLVMMPSDSLQNGIVYHVTDGTDAVSNCQVCLFRSQSLSSTGNCDLATYTLTTNANGIAYLMNIPTGNYYTLLQFKIDSTKSLKGSDNFNVGLAGIAKRTGVVK
ncbi:DUF4198 domain-containing protein [Mucilaginibacter corticis]|uniref:DUF4198 domain-containing protein n=1 Tax=Mucilaginibacter corticis TaxID=2597670 RepID=A0A556MIK5_9SPHI|nr:DUF4198 domain-containing protein [Mucilaginibacter corticis]TSJ39692.1 DUF4198 domain-containing protein [Mucilaginibacter corticis]